MSSNAEGDEKFGQGLERRNVFRQKLCGSNSTFLRELKDCLRARTYPQGTCCETP